MKRVFTILFLLVISRIAFCQVYKYGEYMVLSRDPFSNDTMLAISMPLCYYTTDCSNTYSIVYQVNVKIIETNFDTFVVDKVRLRLIKDGEKYKRLSYVDDSSKISIDANEDNGICISNNELLKIDSFLTWKITHSKFYTSRSCKNDMLRDGLSILITEKIQKRTNNDSLIIWELQPDTSGSKPTELDERLDSMNCDVHVVPDFQSPVVPDLQSNTPLK